DEIASFRPIARALVPRFFCEGHVYWAVYRDAIDSGETATQAAADADDTCLDLTRTEWTLNGCRCNDETIPNGCTSDVLGVPITFHAGGAKPRDPDEFANFTRLADRVPGEDPKCPDGTTRPQSADREIFSDITGATPLAKLPPISDADRADLSQIGAALAAR